jgi:hypothetical protein
VCIERLNAVESLLESGFIPHALSDGVRVNGIVAINRGKDAVEGNERFKTAEAEIQPAQLVVVGSSHEGTETTLVARNDRRADCERFKRRARFRKHEIVLLEERLWSADAIPARNPGNVDSYVPLSARTPDDFRVSLITRGIAENQRAPGTLRQSSTALKSVEVDEIANDDNLVRRNAFVSQQLGTGIIHGDVLCNRWEARRPFFPGQDPVAEVHGRCAGKPQHRRHGIEVVVPVDDIRRIRQRGEIAQYGNARRAEFVGDFTKNRAVRNRLMAAFQEADGDVTNVEFRAGPARERVVSEEHAHEA